MKRRERNMGQARAEAVQIRESGRHPFGVLDRYVPLGAGELQLYRAIREAVPILDAAIWKLIRLAGGVAVKCGEPAAQAGLERFLRTVPTGRGQRGIQSFLDCYLDSMLTCGRGVGEGVGRRWGVGEPGGGRSCWALPHICRALRPFFLFGGRAAPFFVFGQKSRFVRFLFCGIGYYFPLVKR